MRPAAAGIPMPTWSTGVCPATKASSNGSATVPTSATSPARAPGFGARRTSAGSVMRAAASATPIADKAATAADSSGSSPPAGTIDDPPG